ncbi:hypothetical protein QWY75_09490 [Pontixanthobacter aestiaquae]|uniref:Uncharacterized protein n=1 Tax=Pontixanthobacter aestiaquae TaxID=1509367 RepID=A0A844Z1I0_9SPHN|nr:hypothetical protein [Pontixanthobacter aestiaquae]MDN3646430.1 hypothetical protein [Pontixanthobacter aestiaquae]MXO82581.1 hypothetical protein [Pontixanthobacter aestiaquae]
MTSDNFIELVQVLTAVGALFVAVWSFRTSRKLLSQQREHNRKSFQPIAYLRLGNFSGGFKIEIANEGVGPLIIDKVSIRWAKQDKTGPDLVSLLDQQQEPVLWDRYAQRLRGRTIPPLKSITLLSLFEEKREGDSEYARKYKEFSEKALKDISEMLFSLEYKDIYGGKFVYRQEFDWMDPKNAGLPQSGALEDSRDEVGSDLSSGSGAILRDSEAGSDLAR